MKTCTKCGETKLLDGFAVDRSRGDGRQAWCRQCRSIHVAARRATQPQAREYDRRQSRAYHAAMGRLRERHPAEFAALYTEEWKRHDVDGARMP